MVDEQAKDLKLKDVKYTDTTKILKKEQNTLEKCRLTHSEYDDIAQRLDETTKGPIALLRDAVSSKENLAALKDKVDEACEKITLKVNILGFSEQKSSPMQPSVVTDIYKIEIPEV